MCLLLAAAMLLPGSIASGRTASSAQADSTFAAPTVFAFYYVWYTAPPRTKDYGHWNGGQNGRSSTDLATQDYPLLGPYDSTSPSVIDQHMQWLRRAHIDVLILSWWGQGSPEDQAAGPVLSAANANGLKVAFMIEPYGGESAGSVASDVAYIYKRYGSSPAFFRTVRPTRYGPSRSPRGLFLLYSPPGTESWATTLDALHSGATDSIFLVRNDDSRLYHDADARAEVANYHADGLFNYGVYTGRSAYAGKLPHSSDYILMFAASPGFDNSRQPAVQSAVVVGRENGKLYDDSWSPLAAQRPEWVSVVSFNEWLEGTQIEPAQPFSAGSHRYSDFTGAYGTSGQDSQYSYLDRTAYWADKYRGGPPSDITQPKVLPTLTPQPTPSPGPTTIPKRGRGGAVLVLILLILLSGAGLAIWRWRRRRG